ncbi:hypothetical protein [Helicobacter heilmannii]|uniref:hypothetical protein n=1 Tax=Helicobacter heilmannii TaxID=35817 RepID=UPI0006A09079|nr:hypothetical protein [Helicobacter heilmannii]CRF45889.1 hypothetical protein HHE014_08680 [Helicobacter heilmannii]
MIELDRHEEQEGSLRIVSEMFETTDLLTNPTASKTENTFMRLACLLGLYDFKNEAGDSIGAFSRLLISFVKKEHGINIGEELQMPPSALVKADQRLMFLTSEPNNKSIDPSHHKSTICFRLENKKGKYHYRPLKSKDEMLFKGLMDSFNAYCSNPNCSMKVDNTIIFNSRWLNALGLTNEYLLERLKKKEAILLYHDYENGNTRITFTPRAQFYNFLQSPDWSKQSYTQRMRSLEKILHIKGLVPPPLPSLGEKVASGIDSLKVALGLKYSPFHH